MRRRDPKKLSIKRIKTWDLFVQYTNFYWNKPVTRFSWIIRKLTNTPYNHTSEAIWINDELYMIEALGSWIVMRPRDLRRNTEIKKKVVWLRMDWFSDMHEESKYVNKCLSQIGKRYDFVWIWQLFLYITFTYWRKKSVSDSMKSRRCSEYSAWTKWLKQRQTYMPHDFIKNDHFTPINK